MERRNTLHAKKLYAIGSDLKKDNIPHKKIPNLFEHQLNKRGIIKYLAFSPKRKVGFYVLHFFPYKYPRCQKTHANI